jgi:hypothetical protein
MLRYILALWFLPIDFICHLKNEAHRSKSSSFAALRLAYVLTQGKSRRFFFWLFHWLRPIPKEDKNRHAELVTALRQKGITVIRNFLSVDQAKEIQEYLAGQAGFHVGDSFAMTPAHIATMNKGLKMLYSPSTILAAPHVKELIENPFFQEVAAAYLGCQPIFTNVWAWWSIPDENATEKDLNWSAQLFHFDYDWPIFIKFFIYLTDVGPDNGPFTYVIGTHERKHEWHDKRFEDVYIESTYGEAVKALLGSAGDLIIADTAGYHKGQRVQQGGRLILQIEFSASLFGASCQYDLLPKSLKPKSKYSHTFDMFATEE